MEKIELEQRIVEVIKTVYDPEIPVNIYIPYRLAENFKLCKEAFYAIGRGIRYVLRPIHDLYIS